MIKSLIFSFKKSSILFKIAKLKEKSNKIDFSNIFGMLEEKEKNKQKEKELMESLFELLNKNKPIKSLLKKSGISFIDLEKMIKVLELNGGGVVTKGHYVPVSAISFINTLEFLLNHWKEDSFSIEGLDNYNSNLKMVDIMIYEFSK